MGSGSFIFSIAFPPGSPPPAPTRIAKLDLRLANDPLTLDPVPQPALNLNSAQKFERKSPSKALSLAVHGVNGLAMVVGTSLLIGSDSGSFRRGAGTALLSGGAMGFGFTALDKIYGDSPLGLKLGLAYGGGFLIGFGLHFSDFHPGGGGRDHVRNPSDEHPNDGR